MLKYYFDSNFNIKVCRYRCSSAVVLCNAPNEYQCIPYPKKITVTQYNIRFCCPKGILYSCIDITCYQARIGPFSYRYIMSVGCSKYGPSVWTIGSNFIFIWWIDNDVSRVQTNVREYNWIELFNHRVG